MFTNHGTGGVPVALLPNKVYQGDCIRKLNEIEPGSVDLVFADPPFNIGYEYDVYDDRRTGNEYLQFSRQWISAVNKVLKPTGTFWLAIGDEYAAELKLIAQNDVGLTCRSWVMWYYTFGVNCVRAFSRSHTHLFHFVKDPDRFTFNGDNPAVRVASARQLVYADARANSKGRLPDNTWILRPQDVPMGGFSPMHDTWYFARVAGTFKEREGFHGCQMPEQLLGRIIRVSSNPGNLVVDPFAGSGTTLAVAKKLGRRWLGIELSRDYVKSIKSRMDGCRAHDPLDGVPDPVRSAPKTSKGKKRGRFRKGKPVFPLDAETEKGIVDAYKTACKGYSTDIILCNPELNERFVAACKKNSLPGNASAWNRLLLRIRKTGKLPKVGRSRKGLAASEMDTYSAASEVAMQLLSLDYGLTLDDILCSPAAAAEFDQMALQFAGEHKAAAFDYRWAAMAIRKRAKRSRSFAAERFPNWDMGQLSRAMPLHRCMSNKYEHPGVYVVADHGGPLYVGETLNIKGRVEQILNTESWMNFGPKSVKAVETSDQKMRYGLQSHLIGQLNPVLNSVLLRPDFEAPQ
jgi:site-specific DNA-methyltransferase (adenine-specific)